MTGYYTLKYSMIAPEYVVYCIWVYNIVSFRDYNINDFYQSLSFIHI